MVGYSPERRCLRNGTLDTKGLTGVVKRLAVLGRGVRVAKREREAKTMVEIHA